MSFKIQCRNCGLILVNKYGTAAEPNRRKFRVWNSHGNVTKLPMAITDAVVRFMLSVVAEKDIRQQKMSEEVNRKCRPRKRMVQLTTPYTDHNAQRCRQTDMPKIHYTRPPA